MSKLNIKVLTTVIIPTVLIFSAGTLSADERLQVQDKAQEACC